MEISITKNRKKGLVRLLIYIFILVAPRVSLGQNYRFTNYNIEDGLAQSQVRAIFQDSKGYLWIGTLGGGVSRYDGLMFKNFSKREGLCDNNVLSIIEDHTGNLWFGTYGGISKFDGKTFTNLAEGSLSSITVFSILEDRTGNLWFGTDGEGIYRYDGKNFTNITTEDGLSNNIVLSILQDLNDNLWFGTDGSVSVYDGKTFKNMTTEDGLSKNMILSILEDREGNLWFGTDGKGIYRYDGKRFTNITTEDGLVNAIVGSIVEDREGNLWFGTQGGVSKYDGKTFTNLTEKDGLSNNTVWSMLEDREGNLWIGTYRGGIDKYGSTPFTHFTTKEGLSDNVVRSILEDRRGNLWFGTYKGGVCKFDGNTFTNLTAKDGLTNDFILTIFEDHVGNIWFGTYRGVSKYDGKTFTSLTEPDGLANDVIRSILEDHEGNIWFGTDRNGIYRYNGVTFTKFTTEDGLNNNEILTIFKDSKNHIWIGTQRGINIFNGKNFTNFSEKHALNQDEIIFVILEDSEGSLWFGAFGGGIIRYTLPSLIHKEQGENNEWGGSFKTFTSKNGLHDDNVVLMIFDDADNLWIGTEKGLDKLNIEEYKETGTAVFKHYGEDEGFTRIECIHNSVCRDSKRNLWFGTLRGAIKYTSRYDLPNKIEPLTHIINLRLFFEEIDWSTYTDKSSNAVRNINGLPSGLRLPHNKNHLTFDFVGISLVAPEKVRYQYRLEGFDKTWPPATRETYATYSNLPPGKYTFNVKACNNDGLWNKEPGNFSFKITSPFWQMWWFRISGFIAISLLIFTTYQIKTYKVRERNKRLEEINTKLNEQIYERKRGEEAIKKQNTQLELVQQVQSNIPLNLDIETILISAAESIGKLFGFSKVSVNLYKEDTNEIEHIVGWNKLGTPTPKGHKQMLGVGLIGKAAQLKKTIVANDVSKEPSYAVYYQTKTKAELAIPLLVQDYLVGVLDIQDIKQNVFTKEDVSVLQSIANYISYVIEEKLAEEKIKASLKEKEILLKEIHHRVKNNIQIISSLLSLQSRHISDERLLEIFKDSKNRIRSMSIVHEKLYRSEDLARIDLAEYIKSLAQALIKTYNADSRNIELKVKGKDVSLGVDLAIPCGLALNELISNALKHAFPPTWNRNGRIEISVLSPGINEIEIIIKDNGVGIPKNIDFRKTESLGLHLVSILVEDQLKGKMRLNRRRGTRFQINFKRD